MSRAFHHVRAGLFAAGIAAALGFGGQTAAAAPRADAECSDPRQACKVSPQCAAYCSFQGFPRGGVCANGCCACLR